MIRYFIVYAKDVQGPSLVSGYQTDSMTCCPSNDRQEEEEDLKLWPANKSDHDRQLGAKVHS